MSNTICLAFTGASGMLYGVRLLECLFEASCRVQLLYSQAAQIVARQEMELVSPSRASDAQVFFVSAMLHCAGDLMCLVLMSGFQPRALARIRRAPWLFALAQWGSWRQLRRGWPRI